MFNRQILLSVLLSVLAIAALNRVPEAKKLLSGGNRFFG